MDTGIDDAVALLYATASPETELVAVTTCAGNAGLDSVTRNTLAVLELAGRHDVEVARGHRAPLERPLVTAPETHGPGGIGRATLPPPSASPSGRPAVELIVESARERPGELTLVALGPLTNLAAAVLVEPELPRLLRRLVIMGGPYQAGSGESPAVDRNTSVDPEAAAIVYREFGRSGAPLALLVGLDLTRTVRLVPADLAALAKRTGDVPITRFLDDALGFYFDVHEDRYGFRGAFMHDPFVVATALDPELVKTRPRRVSVESGDAAGAATAAGPAVVDRQPDPGGQANVEVAISGAGDRFVGRLIVRLADLA